MAELSGEKLQTILVVGDDYVVLKFIFELLKKAKCVVLQASGGSGGIELAAEYGGESTCFSDVRRSKMSGPDLADALKRFRPDIHVKFMQGFPGDNLVFLNYGCEPFKPRCRFDCSSFQNLAN
jgi:DNA-binding NtrC family response regulator